MKVYFNLAISNISKFFVSFVYAFVSYKITKLILTETDINKHGHSTSTYTYNFTHAVSTALVNF